jgi:hypothetical protein
MRTHLIKVMGKPLRKTLHAKSNSYCVTACQKSKSINHFMREGFILQISCSIQQ